MASIKMKTQIQWIGYNLYCYNRGLAHGNYKNFKKFIEENYK